MRKTMERWQNKEKIYPWQSPGDGTLNYHQKNWEVEEGRDNKVRRCYYSLIWDAVGAGLGTNAFDKLIGETDINMAFGSNQQNKN